MYGKKVKNMKELNYLLRYARETFALLPMQEELEIRFPHIDDCSRKKPLAAVSELTYIGTNDPRVGAVGVRSYFLRCDECHTKREYRAM
jgi:hypothetical protein